MSNTSLLSFLQQLFTDGNIVISGKTEPPAPADIEASQQLLQSIYREEILNIPAPAPAFDAGAALWAAQYLYTALQLIAIREIATEKLADLLPAFTKEKTAAIIFSADLVLRHLPQVLHLAKGLAPADAVVNLLLQTAQQWPFSSVGVQMEEAPDESLILQHSSLRTAYADRIIQAKDLQRIQNNIEVKTAVQEVLGNYTETFWPTFTLQVG